jgi:hypothetical protein
MPREHHRCFGWSVMLSRLQRLKRLGEIKILCVGDSEVREGALKYEFVHEGMERQ